MRIRIAGPVLLLVGAAAASGEQLPPAPKIEGPACAASDAAAFAQETRRFKTSQFNEVTYRRRSGHGSCQAYRGASVCHWSSPNLLQVTSKGRDWWFAPGPGERVVLVFAEGRPRCVIDRARTTEDWASEHLTPPCRASRIKECP